jgi:hypothetical protein
MYFISKFEYSYQFDFKTKYQQHLLLSRIIFLFTQDNFFVILLFTEITNGG